MVRRYELSNGSVVVSSNSEEAPIEVFINPDLSEKKHILTTLNIDEHTLNSSVDPDELPRLEFENDHTAIILKRPKNYSSTEEFLFKVTSIGIFLFKEKLVIVTEEDFPLFEGKTFQRVAGIFDTMLKLVYQTIYHYYSHLKVINQISSEIEEKINTSMENKYLFNMFSLEKSLVYYLDAIAANGVVFERLRNSATKFGGATERIEFLDDIIIENRQCYKQAEIYSTILSNLMDARAGIVNNNLNILIKRLTIISIVFLPLNLLASIGGMSEYTMMTQKIDWKISYGLFMLAMVAIGYITYLLVDRIGAEREWTEALRRRAWLRRARGG